MEIKNDNGTIKTLDELRDEVIDALVEVLENLDDDEALDLGNEFRDADGMDILHKNYEEELNDVLDGWSPYDLLNAGHNDWSDYDDYFALGDWGAFETTDDVWAGIELEDLAEEMLNGTFTPKNMPDDAQEILDEYEEAKEKLENYNPYRAECQEVINKFVNCEADVTDLLQMLDRLARTDEAWAKEDE